MLRTHTTLSVMPWRLFPDNHILVLAIPVLSFHFFPSQFPRLLGIDAVMVWSGLLAHIAISTYCLHLS